MTLTEGILAELKGRRVALVYSFPKPSDPPNRWYDRWKSRVVMSHGEALERIGVHPFYCDVDSFIRQASCGQLSEIDAVISLNAGVRPVSHFALVPAVAQWFQMPIIPCTADVIMAGERKDLGNSIAIRSGLRVPTVYQAEEMDLARATRTLIVKPRDLGGSFGLKRISGKQLTEADFAGGKIVQEFVAGFDVTIPVFVDARTGELEVAHATVYRPSYPDPTNWIYDRDAKEAYVGGTGVASVERIQFPLEQCAVDRIRTFAHMIGVDCFARIDFRLEAASADNLEPITADQLAFIEINPMPTVCTGLAFVESVRSWVSWNLPPETAGLGRSLDPSDDYDIIAYVLGHALARQLGPAKMNDRNQVGS